MIQELIAIAGDSNGAYNGGVQAGKSARHLVERLRNTTVDFLHHGPQATARALVPKQGKPQKARGGNGPNTQKAPAEVTPFRESG
jgi:hypothetical protein